MRLLISALSLLAISLSLTALDGYEYVSPQPDSILNSRQSCVIIRHGEAIDVTSLSPALISVSGSVNGDYPGQLILATDRKTVIFDPHRHFALSETVTVSLKKGVKTADGDELAGCLFSFTTETVESNWSDDGATDPGVLVNRDPGARAPLGDGPSDPLPPPTITVNVTNNPTSDKILMATWDRNNPHQFGNFLFVLDGEGNILESIRVDGAPFDFQLQPNGQYSVALGDFAGNVPGEGEQLRHLVMNADFDVVDSFQMKNGYPTDFHEFLLLPNGHALMMSYYGVPYDMSTVVPGGRPDAELIINIIQEQDQDKNVVFEWRNIDHLPITDSDFSLTGTRINYSTLNAFELDRDGNLLASFRNHSEIMKISRTTGEILWRWGSTRGEFAFVGENEENAPYYFSRQHDIRRLANGNVSIFDNGEVHSPRYSRSVEYELDEVNKVATMVSENRYPDGNIFAGAAGSAQPLPDGGWFLCYGILHPISPVKRQLVEYHADGTTALELSLPNGVIAYRARKVTGNSAPISVSHSGLVEGQTYVFNEVEATTGVSLQINAIETVGDAAVTVSREPLAPLNPAFSSKAPRVLPLRVTISESEISSLATEVIFDAASFGFADETGKYGYVDPESLTVFRRTPGTGTAFVPLQTQYDSDLKELTASTTELGEFVFGDADAEEIPNPPILISPADEGSVNEELAVDFSWTPRGFARASHLQVATDAAFTDLVVDEPGLMAYGYSWSAANAGTTYFYRVSVSNNGGTSEWSAASFGVVPPAIRVTTPNGGESWPRGLQEFILWEDNLIEPVVLELFKGDTFVKEIGTVPSTGGYQWEVALDLEAGDDYFIHARSSANPAISDRSDLAFNIGVPSISGSRLQEDGSLVLEWTGAVLNNVIEFSPEIPATSWQDVGGPVVGFSWTNSAPSAPGVYRLRSE